MAQPDSSSLAEVLDRVLDKGIVVDTFARNSLPAPRRNRRAIGRRLE